VSWVEPPTSGRVLDICTGSGDLAFLLARKVGRGGEVRAVDFAPEILEVARERYEAQPRCDRYMTDVEFIEGDALALPFEDASFDGATMGYGLRNVADIPQALREIRRVLREGSRAAILDFNNPRDSPVVDKLQARGFGARARAETAPPDPPPPPRLPRGVPDRGRARPPPAGLHAEQRGGPGGGADGPRGGVRVPPAEHPGLPHRAGAGADGPGGGVQGRCALRAHRGAHGVPGRDQVRGAARLGERGFKRSLERPPGTPVCLSQH